MVVGFPCPVPDLGVAGAGFFVPKDNNAVSLCPQDLRQHLCALMQDATRTVLPYPTPRRPKTPETWVHGKQTLGAIRPRSRAACQLESDVVGRNRPLWMFEGAPKRGSGPARWMNPQLLPDKLLDFLHAVYEFVIRFAEPVRVVDHVRREEDHEFGPRLGGGLRAEHSTD